jgi:hypothetical protein
MKTNPIFIALTLLVGCILFVWRNQKSESFSMSGGATQTNGFTNENRAAKVKFNLRPEHRLAHQNLQARIQELKAHRDTTGPVDEYYLSKLTPEVKNLLQKSDFDRVKESYTKALQVIGVNTTEMEKAMTILRERSDRRCEITFQKTANLLSWNSGKAELAKIDDEYLGQLAGAIGMEGAVAVLATDNTALNAYGPKEGTLVQRLGLKNVPPHVEALIEKHRRKSE